MLGGIEYNIPLKKNHLEERFYWNRPCHHHGGSKETKNYSGNSSQFADDSCKAFSSAMEDDEIILYLKKIKQWF